MSARAAVMEWIEATEIILIGVPPSALECIGPAGSRPKKFRSDCRASLIKWQYPVCSIKRGYPPTGRNRRAPGADEPGGYLGWAVLGLVASCARAAIQASYSGDPRRGGTPGGSPPIQCGISASRSPTVWAQADSETQARQSRAHLIFGEVQFIGRLVSSQCGERGARSWRGWGEKGGLTAANSRAVALWGR